MKFDKPFGRVHAYFDMHIVDHGLVREVYNNLYGLPGAMYRSSQPSPSQLARYQKKFGLRSVINLRGTHDYGSFFLEEEACQRLGLSLYHTKLYSRTAPSIEEIHTMETLFKTIQYPALLHCKSGADRAGLGAALYQVIICNAPAKVAMRELHWKYGHFKNAKTGILDYFFEVFDAWKKNNPEGEFMTWVDTIYNEDQLNMNFKAGKLASWVVDDILHRE